MGVVVETGAVAVSARSLVVVGTSLVGDISGLGVAVSVCVMVGGEVGTADGVSVATTVGVHDEVGVTTN